MKIGKELDLQRPPQNGSVDVMVNNSRMAKPIPQAADEEIKQALRYIFGLIGMRGENLPDDGEKMILMDYVRKNFKRFTVEDIKTAFTFYVQKLIDYQEPPYQRFSVLFLENVMQSYRRLQITIPKPVYNPLPEKTKPTAQEIDIIERNAALKKFQEYKDHMDLWDFGGATFAFLWRLGLIRLTEEKRDQLKLKAERELVREAQMEIKNGKRPSEIATVVEAIQAGNDNQVRLRMRKLALMDYFETLITQGVELKEVLK